MQMTPEEQQRIIEEYYDAVRQGIPITQDMHDRMVAASVALQNYAAAQNALLGTAKALGKAFGDYTQAVYKGKKGAEALGDGIDTVTTAVQTLGLAVMTLVGGPLGLLAGGLGIAVGAVGKYAKATTEMSDKLYSSWTELSQVGGAAAGGMTEVYKQMQQFGLSIDELSDMTSLVKQNSSALATFGGTVANGTKMLADTVGDLRDSGFNREFMAMGHSINDINNYAASYIKQQTMLGRSQSDIQKNLNAGTIEYSKNLDALSRLTGDSREAQEAKQEAAMAEDAYAATMYNLQKRADAGDAAAAAQLKKLDTLNKILPAEAAAEMRKAVGGDISAASKMMMSAPDAYRALLDPMASAGKTMDALAKGYKNTQDTFGGLIGMGGNADGTFVHFNEMLTTTAKYTGENGDEQIAAAKRQQDASAATDKSTQSQIDLRLAQQNSMQNMQDFVKIGVNPATSALSTLAEVVEDLTSLLPGAGASSKHKNDAVATSGGAVGTKGGKATATQVGGVAGAIAGAATGAEIGGSIGLALGGVTAVPGAAIGGLIGAGLGLVGGGVAGNTAYGTFGGDKGVGKTSGAETAMSYFQSQGWTKEQAAGIVGNLQAESGPSLNPKAEGDNRQAYGIAQWHPDRQATFKQQMQKEIRESSLEEQLQFVQWELSNTQMGAGNALRSAKAANEAAQIIDRMYERSSGTALNKRMANANTLAEAKAEFGGIVRARPGGTNILAGEAGSDEAFVPLAHGKIPVDIKDSAFMKEFVKSLIGNMAPDQQRSGNLAKEQADLLRQLMPEFSRAISLGVSDIKLSQPTVDKPQIDPQALAKAVAGNLGDTKQPSMDPQALAKLISNTMSDFKAVQPAVGELTRNPTPDTKIADSMNNIKLLLDSFVNTKIPSPGEMLKSVMPDFSKILPVNDMVNAIAEKINQQTAQKEKVSTTAPPPAADNSQQLALMSQQLTKLDELVRVMNSQLNVSGKILAYQH